MNRCNPQLQEEIYKYVKKSLHPLSTKMPWKDEKDLLVFYDGPQYNEKQKRQVAAFDLDGTVVKTKSGNKFAKNALDWIFLYPNVQKKLIELSNSHLLVIFTNQGWSKEDKITDFKSRMEAIYSALGSPIIYVFAAARKDSQYRKPSAKMFARLQEIVDVDVANSFYVGDAAGRKDDFEDTDRTFAINCGIKFYTPEEYFLKESAQDYKLKVDFNVLDRVAPNKFAKKDSEMLILVGRAGSGKSTFVQENLDGYCHVNQDTLKTKEKCVKAVEKYAATYGNKRIVIDNTNPTKEVRQLYINIAKKNNIPVRILHFTADANLCKHNNAYRAAIGEKDSVPEIAYRIFEKNFVPPTIDEGAEIVEVPFAISESAPKEWKRYYV